MALKALVLKQRIDSKTRELQALQERDKEFSARESELLADIDAAAKAGDEERTAVEAAVETFDAEQAAHKSAKTALETDIQALQTELDGLEKQFPAVAAAAAETNKERSVPPMNTTVNIRELPRTQRAFQAAYPTAHEQKAFVEQPNVSAWLTQVRELGKINASVSGAELAIPVEILPLIMENQFRYSKLQRRVNYVSVAGEARVPVAGLVNPAVWEECCGALNELTFQFGVWPMSCWKVAGYVTVCNALLQDTDIALLSALVEMISMSIGMSKDMAILYGTGNGMPLGIVPRLAQSSKPAGYPTSALDWVDLHSTNLITIDGTTLSGAAFWAALTDAVGHTFTRYSRGELFWAMNSKTYNYLRGKAIATSVTGEWVALIGGTLPIVSGDIDVLEFMPDYDIVGGYGELYTYAAREGLTVGVDSVGFVNRVKDQTLIYGKERGDGAPIVPGAFIAMNIHNSSPTTSLSFPADEANDASLQALTVGALSLSPSFDAGTLTYTASAANNVASAAVTATPEQAEALVGITVTSGTTTKNVVNGGSAALAVGSNVIKITVKQGNGVKVYTVTVTRAAS